MGRPALNLGTVRIKLQIAPAVLQTKIRDESDD